jgi:hypothetical protein
MNLTAAPTERRTGSYSLVKLSTNGSKRLEVIAEATVNLAAVDKAHHYAEQLRRPVEVLDAAGNRIYLALCTEDAYEDHIGTVIELAKGIKNLATVASRGSVTAADEMAAAHARQLLTEVQATLIALTRR